MSIFDELSTSDGEEELEADVRRELVMVARLNRVSDPETLKDILLDCMPASGVPRSDPAGRAEAADRLERQKESKRWLNTFSWLTGPTKVYATSRTRRSALTPASHWRSNRAASTRISS